MKTQLGKPAPAAGSANDSPVLARANSDFWEGLCGLDFCKPRQANSCLAALQMAWAAASWGGLLSQALSFSAQNR